MKSHFQTHASDSGSGARNAVSGAMPYLSERQMQAYLVARDAIRRIQRTSSIFNAIEKDAARGHGAAHGARNSH